MAERDEALEALRDEADAERLARRRLERVLRSVGEAAESRRRGPLGPWSGDPEALPEFVRRVLDDLWGRVAQDCPKCDGEGWLWRHELDDPGEDYLRGREGRDDTRYTCDRCKGRGAAFPEDE